MTHGIEALVGHFAQLLRDALLDHLEVFVPLLCVSFETGPLGALPLSNDSLRHRLEDRISACYCVHWGILPGEYVMCLLHGGSLLPHIPLLGRVRGFDEGLTVRGGEACGH